MSEHARAAFPLTPRRKSEVVGREITTTRERRPPGRYLVLAAAGRPDALPTGETPA